MSVSYTQAQKQRYRITLDLEVLSDFNPHQIDWEELFNLEGNERVESYIEDLNNPTSWWSLMHTFWEYQVLVCQYDYLHTIWFWGWICPILGTSEGDHT